MNPSGSSANIGFNFALIAFLGSVAVAGVEAQPGPDRLRASVALSSDYVLHGLAQTRDRPSLHVSLDFEHEAGFFAGGSLANVDYEAEAGFSTPRDSLLTLYGGYVWRKGPWASNVALSRYVYPDIVRDYDYTQIAVTASFRDRYFLTAARSSDYLAVYDTSRYVRAGVAVPWSRGLEFGINAGRFTTGGAFGTSYDFWDAGVSRAAGRLALDLRFHDNGYGRASLLGNATGNLWVLSLTYVFLPLDRSGP
jgi:uncharacterized protein (TIGR02001 family)